MTMQSILEQLDQNGAPLAKETAGIIRGQAKELNEVEQILGKALGYPELYEADDPEKGPITCGTEYPNAKPTGTVCVGDHVPATLAQEAANRIRSTEEEVAHLHGLGVIHGAVYVASRASIPERGAMWRRFREQGVNIVSSWIDEDGKGQTASYRELWDRITRELAMAERVVLYAEEGDFPLKGALIEAGIALGMNKPVTVCLPGVDVRLPSLRPIGSWIAHKLVIRQDQVERALDFRELDLGVVVAI